METKSETTKGRGSVRFEAIVIQPELIMTFDDDFVRMNFENGGNVDTTCKKIGVSWPPPEEINFQGKKLKLKRHSKITDEQRREMTHVVRGAEYIEVV